MAFLEIRIVFLIIAAGFIFYINRAWKERKYSNRLKNFFLGGGSLGPDLTEHNSLGMTFAWSGGTWFFATTAYTYGPWVILLQIPWCLSLIFLGILFTRIHKVTRNKTIHGYLQDSYGNDTRKIGSIATSLGYVFNTGFEIFWSSLLLSNIFGHPNLALPIALLFALITAVYCSIGGYRANASTDKPQNILGVIALSSLSLFVSFSTNSTPLRIASLIFCAGSAIYILFSIITPIRIKKISVFAIGLAAIAIIISIIFSFHPGAIGENKDYFVSHLFPTHLLIGLIVFQLIFNVVDMANWQGIAANGDIDVSEHRSLRWAIIRSALYLNWFPALGGSLIGLAFRSGFGNSINDSNIFQYAFAAVMPHGGEIFRGVVLGVILLGFISTTLSTADSYLMSASQTLMYDLLYHNEIRDILINPGDENREKQYIVKAKALLLPLSILMVTVFWVAYGLYKKINGDALDFQMIMYSFAISLIAPILFALFKGTEKSMRNKKAAFFAILGGILAAILPYTLVVALGIASETRRMMVSLSPVFSLILSTSIFFIGYTIKKRTR